MGRVLGATRLSHDTDASTSIERQREAIEAWARAHGHQLVTVTEDTDVSGTIAPRDRDGLGPWLPNGKIGQWDVLVVARLDRVSRPLLDFAPLPKPLKTEARQEVRDTAELLTGRWLSLETDHERGALLRSMGFRIMASKAWLHALTPAITRDPYSYRDR
jgi:DNA invertase Pin-like site-specific DNA recombinase